MVKYCILGDIHGNYPALKAVVNNTDDDKVENHTVEYLRS